MCNWRTVKQQKSLDELCSQLQTSLLATLSEMPDGSLGFAEGRTANPVLRKAIYAACEQYTGREDFKRLSFRFEEDRAAGKVICHVEGPIEVMSRICFGYRKITDDIDVTVTMKKEAQSEES